MEVKAPIEVINKKIDAFGRDPPLTGARNYRNSHKFNDERKRRFVHIAEKLSWKRSVVMQEYLLAYLSTKYTKKKIHNLRTSTIHGPGNRVTEEDLSKNRRLFATEANFHCDKKSNVKIIFPPNIKKDENENVLIFGHTSSPRSLNQLKKWREKDNFDKFRLKGRFFKKSHGNDDLASQLSLKHENNCLNMKVHGCKEDVDEAIEDKFKLDMFSFSFIYKTQHQLLSETG
ncbi:hypothetical protein RF11_13354 [Thelohanellus kitauei]|uniref:Uncharacterized protein n=1 Tax=Thelohanellus kitauei TaxID=669202 RepID=A0A0C2JGA3_THEKT|nr:hypothetical protein RF11_13354 [Thelohanellus kitauei]